MKYVVKMGDYYVCLPGKDIHSTMFKSELEFAWRWEALESAQVWLKTAKIPTYTGYYEILPVQENVEALERRIDELETVVARLMERVEELENR